MFAHNPLHGSGQAGFPHPALTLGDDAHAAQGIGMTDGRQRQPASDEAPHAIPKDTDFVAALGQRAMPEPPYLEPENPQRVVVPRHTVIPVVPSHHRLQPLAHFGDWFMHPSLKFGLHLVQLRLQPFADCLPQHREPSVAPLLHADVREAKKVERLRFPFSTPLPLVDRKRTELQQSRSKSLTRLNTRPARSPANASTPPLRAAPHDSGPMWVATSHSYDSFIHYTSPV
jgi:hypothetical protein